jgi:ribonuclease D
LTLLKVFHFGFNNKWVYKKPLHCYFSILPSQKSQHFKLGAKTLTPQQINYAAADAYAALLVF